ncbi:sulfurtransferase [Arcobacter sp. LA11]|uniref:sulfurtransferase n=1 Tax=Arcobacter sp. LA11 TaxID=1898176 RepID=UPI0009324C61|nr:sulfurtransferase [Arcobacter sp. LA11]
MIKNEKKSPIFKAEELNKLLDKEEVKVFDVRGIWGSNPSSLYEEYEKEHIKGAAFLDWRKEFLEQNKDPNIAQICSKDEAKESFKNLGINKEDTVILYDDYFNMFAGRVWWAMKYWGFENVYVLDGGLKYWKEQNLPISKEIPATSIGSFEPSCKEELRISLENVIKEKDSSCLFDARGVANYNGKEEDSRSGHIPGAINTAFNTVLDKETGLFLEKEELNSLFETITPKEYKNKIIVSCGSGYASTVVMLALESLDIKSTLFDESFAIWKEDINREVEQSY